MQVQDNLLLIWANGRFEITRWLAGTVSVYTDFETHARENSERGACPLCLAHLSLCAASLFSSRFCQRAVVLLSDSHQSEFFQPSDHP